MSIAGKRLIGAAKEMRQDLRTLQDTARILCRYEGGKEWEEANQQERDHWLKAAKDMQDIIHAPWPTHLAHRTVN